MESTRLGWIDFMFRADGESFNLEAEVTGKLVKKFFGEHADLEIDGVYLHGPVRVNMLPALSGDQVRAIAADVKPQARLRDENPGQWSEA